MSACLTAATGGAAEPPAAPNAEQSQPFPISLAIDTPVVLVRHIVNFSGRTTAILSNDVSLHIEAPKAAPPQSSVLKSTAGMDGTFSFRFTPTVSGLYTVVVAAPDHKGTSTTQFRAVDPTSGSGDQDLPQAIPRLIRYVPQILDELVRKVDNLPPSPAKNNLKQKMQDVVRKANDLELPANEVAGDLGTLLAAKWTIEDHPDKVYQRTSSNGEAEGESTAEFKVCNPGC